MSRGSYNQVPPAPLPAIRAGCAKWPLPIFRWSTGVIMYTLLAGSPPFWHRKQMLMLRMIMSGNYQFGSPEWDDYSDTVKDLVRGQASGKGKGRRQLPGETPAASEMLDVFNVPSQPPFHLPPTQVSRFLVVQPQKRYTAEEALAHPFFQQYVVEEVRHFSPRGKLKVLRCPSPRPSPDSSCHPKEKADASLPPPSV